jgi:hypothetical protein
MPAIWGESPDRGFTNIEEWNGHDKAPEPQKPEPFCDFCAFLWLASDLDPFCPSE